MLPAVYHARIAVSLAYEGEQNATFDAYGCDLRKLTDLLMEAAAKIAPLGRWTVDGDYQKGDHTYTIEGPYLLNLVC